MSTIIFLKLIFKYCQILKYQGLRIQHVNFGAHNSAHKTHFFIRCTVVLEDLDTEVVKNKTMARKKTLSKMKEIPLSLHKDDIIVYTGSPKKSTNKQTLLELIHKISKVAGYTRLHHISVG